MAGVSPWATGQGLAAKGARGAATRSALALASRSLCRDNRSGSRFRGSRCGRFSPERAPRLPASLCCADASLRGPHAKQRPWADSRSARQWRPRRPRTGPSRGSWRTRPLRLPLWWRRPNSPAGVSTRSWAKNPRSGMKWTSWRRIIQQTKTMV